MKRLTMLALAVIGCAGEDDAGVPTECDRDDRRGTYLVQYTQTDGDCGPLPDELIILPPSADNPAVTDCEFDERWSKGNCRVDTEASCFDGSRLVGYSEQVDSNAGVLRGKATVTGPDNRCRSTYEIEWTRE